MDKVTVRPYPDLATWREAKRLSQVEAAEFLGISQAAYSRLERRAQAVRGKQARAIMEKTGVPIEVLVGAA